MSAFERVAPKFARIAGRYDEIERQISDPGVASDGPRLAVLLRERGAIAETVALFRRRAGLLQEIEDARVERAASKDEAMQAYCDELVTTLSAELPGLEHSLLAEIVRDEDDRVASAILEVRAGTGGDEASLWAADLFRMYARFCERRGWKFEVLEEYRSAVDGFKEVIASITGPSAYALLKYESGGHRVQRVPETEAQGRIHTSAATVAILPEATEVQVDIKDSDLRIDTFRSSGPGGQNVNKVSSAIRVTHIPTGMVVACQDEKSQHKNKAKALKILRARLYDAEQTRLHQQRSEARKSLIGSGDRSERIRTYNFPQSRITDHRINLNLHNLQAVLDGDLNELVEALGRYDREQRIQELVADMT